MLAAPIIAYTNVFTMCTVYTWFGKSTIIIAASNSPIRLNMAYSISWSLAETETKVFKMVAKLHVKYKRTLITTMRNKIRALATFHNPIHSLWSLPLRNPLLLSVYGSEWVQLMRDGGWDFGMVG